MASLGLAGVEGSERSVGSVAVVGLGLIGAAACRHLSSLAGVQVVGIGPAEPVDLKSHQGVFSAHYDEGRLTRIVDKDAIWSKLAARSMMEYPNIEKKSGIRFHYPVGFVRVSPMYRQIGDSMIEALEVGRENGAAVEIIENAEALKVRLPCFQFETDDVGLIELGSAGYVNPRRMVEAQLLVSAKQGAEIVRETVVSIAREANGLRITTDKSRELSVARVLICADAYTNLILPGPKLVLNTVAETYLLAEVGNEEARGLQAMPSLIWRLRSHSSLHSVYGCPPIRYSDGKLYVKLGGTSLHPVYLHSDEDIVKWFHSDGRPEEFDILLNVLKSLMPELQILSGHTKPCMVTFTSHNHPYIDALDNESPRDARIFVATGGCGAAAKSADEIGRIAALLIGNGAWAYDLDASIFKAVFVDAVSGDCQFPITRAYACT